MTTAEKVHYWMLKYEIANGTSPKPKEISAQLEMAIEEENQASSIADVSNRRELLIAFLKAQHGILIPKDENYITERVDLFIKSNL